MEKLYSTKIESGNFLSLPLFTKQNVNTGLNPETCVETLTVKEVFGRDFQKEKTERIRLTRIKCDFPKWIMVLLLFLEATGSQQVLSLDLAEKREIKAPEFAGLYGTKSNPYQIETWEHLRNISGNPESFFILNNDLDSLTADYSTFAAAISNSNRGWIPIYGDDIRLNGQDYTS